MMQKITAKLSPKKFQISTPLPEAPLKTYKGDCEICHHEFSFTSKDLHVGEYGCVWAECPYCGKRTYVLCPEEELLLTEENLKFPLHFADFSKGIKIPDTEVESMCKQALKNLKNNKTGLSYEGTGNTIVIAVDNDVDNETDLYVCKNYYHTVVSKFNS